MCTIRSFLDWRAPDVPRGQKSTLPGLDMGSVNSRRNLRWASRFCRRRRSTGSVLGKRRSNSMMRVKGCRGKEGDTWMRGLSGMGEKSRWGTLLGTVR
jgi:hypothetical protein